MDDVDSRGQDGQVTGPVLAQALKAAQLAEFATDVPCFATSGFCNVSGRGQDEFGDHRPNGVTAGIFTTSQRWFMSPWPTGVGVPVATADGTFVQISNHCVLFVFQNVPGIISLNLCSSN